jgi:RNA polymerase sigma-70 factor (ECF subfamily)
MKIKFTTWLYTITVNLAYDLIKSNTRQRRRLLNFTTAREENSTGAIEEEENIVNRDLAARIKQMAGDLPPKQRMVFALRDLQDLTVEEVARILSMSPGAVKTNLCYARRFIRARLERLEATGSKTP